MTAGRLIQIRGWLAYLLAAAYLLAGFAGFFADFDKTSDTVIWIALTWSGAALIIVGLLAVKAPSWLTAALLSVGGVAGGLALFWTIFVPVAVAALVAMSVVIARRSPQTA